MENKNLLNVAIIGRPNVGKSTLFNRLIQKRVSIMDDTPGVTRDRIVHVCSWLDKKFNLIDTGGYSKDTKISFQEEINRQVKIAIDKADIIIFVVSAVSKITKEDLDISFLIKRIKKPIILASNKSDNLDFKYSNFNFLKLGLGEPISISSIHGIGISDLLDKIISFYKKEDKSETIEGLRIGILGKPNVGKSTLVNSLLNDYRVIVSDIAGTTRDAIDSYLKIGDKNYILTDTAGLKKNKKSLNDIEWYSELRTELTILNSDITILLLDPTQDISQIDEKILGILKSKYKPIIVCVNKSDIMSSKVKNNIIQDIKTKFKFAPWLKTIFISALNKENINEIIKLSDELEESKKKDIKKSDLNEFLMDIQIIKKPPRFNGINIKFSYVTYSNLEYPHFIFFVNKPELVHFSYKRFIENQIRNVFGFDGIPIKISLRKSE